MGLEFQSRSFLHLHPDERMIVNERSYVLWCTTGRKQNFWHNCQDAKWSSFDAVRHVYENLDALKRSRGFFALTADFCDIADRDRAYCLDGELFREAEAEGVFDRERTPAGLYSYFLWCHYACYLIGDGPLDWEQPASAWQEFTNIEEEVDLAGWFFIEKPCNGFHSLPELFPKHVAGLSHAGGGSSEYLFIGEEQIPFSAALRPLIEASRRFPQGRGWVTLLNSPGMPQYGIANGHVYELDSLDWSSWRFYPDVQFTTGRFGYEPRPQLGTEGEAQ
jgi:hypothetical protein